MLSSIYSGCSLYVNFSPLISAMAPVTLGLVTNSSTALTAVDIGVRIMLSKSARSLAMFVAIQIESVSQPLLRKQSRGENNEGGNTDHGRSQSVDLDPFQL